MRKLLPLFLLIFATASFGQTRGHQVKYDKFKHKTTANYIRLNAVKDVLNAAKNVSMIVTADYPGEK